MKKHASFAFVSHRLTEVRAISDTIHVMKDGRLSETLSPADADEKMLHGLMVVGSAPPTIITSVSSARSTGRRRF